MNVNDPYFKISVLSKSERPNLLSYLAMHQCVAESPVVPFEWEKLNEPELGKRVVNHCLKFGHHSVIEHPTITFLVQGYPHHVMVQLTRHRHLSFSVQSQRYTGKRISDLGNYLKKHTAKIQCVSKIEQLFYARPIGEYTDREGNTFLQTKNSRIGELLSYREPIKNYAINVSRKMPFEMAREALPQAIRQDFIVTMSARSLLHLCDLRTPKDAQLEVQDCVYSMFAEFKTWMPEVGSWYESNRLGKNKLAP